jgi:hypothetical protein
VATGMGILFVLGMLLFHRNHRMWAMLVLMVLLLGGGVYIGKYLSKTTAFQQRVVKTNAGGPGVLDYETRFALWRAAWQMWQDHFWFGVGPAHFDYRFPEYRPVIIQERPNRSHNDYINLCADWGMVGGLLVLGGFGIFLVSWLKTFPHVRPAEADLGSTRSNRFAFFVGASGGLCSLGAHSAADFNLHIPANALVGVTLLALLTAQSRFATAHHWFRAGRPARLALAGTLTIALLALSTDGWRRGQETYWLAQAEREDLYSPAMVELLQKAFAAEPENFQTAFDIGESFRMRSFQGGVDFAPLAKQAIDWYARDIRLDPIDGYGFMRTGMCLDWLGQTVEAVKYYEQAEPLDPNGYFMVANIGWHFVQIGDFSLARKYFIRSMTLSNASAFASNYRQICEDKLIERASGRPTLPFNY